MRTGKIKNRLWTAFVLIMAVGLFTGCGQPDEEETVAETDPSATDVSAADSATAIYINGTLLELEEEGELDLDLLSVENGITVTVAPCEDSEIQINGEATEGEIFLDVDSITREDTIEIEIADEDETRAYTVNLMPSTFGDFTTEGESATEGDYYLSTYDEDINYIFKLDSQGNLIFYKKTGENALDFRKQYNSDGEVRYTYLLYLENSFCGISGINPGCIVVMDETYEVIDEIYYQTPEGEERMIDPHGFIYIDDGHYILASYVDEVVEAVPDDLEAVDGSAYLAVLYMEEIQDGEILWEFCSADYPEFLSATTEVDWSESTSECYDYMHFNSMYIDNDENLLVSLRNCNSIIKLSRGDGSLVWILGGSEDEFGLTEDQIFSKQHSIIVTDDGSYMLFNNADDEVANGEAEVSSVIRLRVDEETMQVTEYEKTDTEFYSNYMGSIRELDSENGIYLYAVGGNWTGTVPEWSMIEYSTAGEKLFTFRFDEGSRLLYCANKCE
ncbi:MAG: arylsulfotransferase family protein [Lachnospiraceae bacterium]|nr:arylsulfotransferase family protein [Lachnospiraceae bacterium]